MMNEEALRAGGHSGLEARNAGEGKFDKRFYVACPKKAFAQLQGIVAITTCLKCDSHEFDDGNNHRCLLKELVKK